MKRLMWVAVLFLLAVAGTPSRLDACDWRSFVAIPEEHTAVINEGGSTIMITSDEDFITIVTYSNSDIPSEWM